jgi:hypothetical protein
MFGGILFRGFLDYPVSGDTLLVVLKCVDSTIVDEFLGKRRSSGPFSRPISC